MLGDDSSFDRTTTVDIVVRATPPPSWLPDWFLDRLPRPPHEQPMSPNVRRARAGVPSSETRDAPRAAKVSKSPRKSIFQVHHQSICFGLDMVDVLILSLSTCRSLMKLDTARGVANQTCMIALVRAEKGVDGSGGSSAASPPPRTIRPATVQFPGAPRGVGVATAREAAGRLHRAAPSVEHSNGPDFCDGLQDEISSSGPTRRRENRRRSYAAVKTERRRCTVC